MDRQHRVLTFFCLMSALQLWREGAVLGTALLPNLTLLMGNNTLSASSQFEVYPYIVWTSPFKSSLPYRQTTARRAPKPSTTLSAKQVRLLCLRMIYQLHSLSTDVALNIAGYSGSTEIASLLQAFESLNISVTLPGLKTNLLGTAAVEGKRSFSAYFFFRPLIVNLVLPTTGRANNISHVTVDLVNPFTAALRITQISSTVSYEGITLGTINTTTGFSAPGKSTTTSPTLDLDMNLDPAALFTITRSLAVKAGLDVAPLDAIVQLGGIQYLSPTNTSSRRQANEFTSVRVSHTDF